MKISCEIIKDLLPLYNDKVCSKDTGDLVEEHLAECADCRVELDKISREFDCPKIKRDAGKPLQAIAAVWKKDKARAFVKGTVIAVAACAILFGIFLVLIGWRCIPLSSDVLAVSEVSQLSDGIIVYRLDVKNGRDFYFKKFTLNEDGSFYITPYRAIIEDKKETEDGIYHDYYMIDVAESNAYHQALDGIEITSCYIGPEGDGILIWEKGMALPPASEELENRFVHQNDNPS